MMRTLLLTFFMVVALWAEIGTINLLNGNVTIQRGDQNLVAQIGADVEENDVFKTGPKAFVKILFNDSTTIIVGKSSTFQIQQFSDEKNKEVAKFKILKGVLESTTGKIGKIAPDKFNVITRTSKIGVRGTVFQVMTDGTRDTISCTEGSIGVTELNTGVTVVVSAGEMTTVTSGAAPSVPSQIGQGIDPLSTYEGGNTDEALQSLVSTQNSSEATNQMASDVQNIVDAKNSTSKHDNTAFVASNLNIDDISITATENGSLVSGNLQVSSGSTYSVVGSSPDGFTLNGDGSYSFNPGHSSYDSLSAGEARAITFDYQVSDGTNTLTKSGSININGINDAPTGLSAISGSVNEDNTISGSVSASDADGDSLTYTLTSSAPTGLTFNSDGSYSFNASSYDSLAAGGSQTVSFTYQVSDGTAAASESGSIVIHGVNDAPVVSGVSTSVSEDSTVSGSVSASDADGDSLTYTLTSSAPTGLTFNSDGSYSFDASSYDSLAAGGSQTVSFTYQVSDGTTTTSESGSILISGVNDAPTASSTYNLTSVVNSNEMDDAPYGITLQGNIVVEEISGANAYTINASDLLSVVSDSDSGDSLSVDFSSISVDASYGSITDNGDGTYKLTLVDKKSYAGLPITYNVIDGKGGTVTNTAYLDVAGFDSSVWRFPGDGALNANYDSAVSVGTDSPYEWGWWTDTGTTASSDIHSWWLIGPRSPTTVINSGTSGLMWNDQNYVYEACSSSVGSCNASSSPIWGLFNDSGTATAPYKIGETASSAYMRLEIDFGGGSGSLVAGTSGGSYLQFTEETGNGWDGGTYRVNFENGTIDTSGLTITNVLANFNDANGIGVTGGSLVSGFYGRNGDKLGGRFSVSYTKGSIGGGFLATQTSP